MPGGDLRVAVLGASGYVGGELLRLLSGHPEVGEVRAYSASGVGKVWGDVHPSLAHLPPARFEAADAGAAAAWADVLFLALPHGSSQTAMAEIEAAGPRLVVDTAADFRLHDRSLAESTYGPHADFDRVAVFRYGLADVEGEALAGATRIAAPGCFATAALLALWPLARAGGFAEAPVCVAATGSSGSGAEPKPATHHPRRAHNFFAYGLAGHRHEAELIETLRGWTGDRDARCTLVTQSAPLVRGIHACIHARPSSPVSEPLELFREAYAGKRFVRVLERPPEVAPVVATNFVHVHAVARDGGREVIVLVTLDNLVKGAAGQAVQCANLALGLDEGAGLGFPGVTPC